MKGLKATLVVAGIALALMLSGCGPASSATSEAPTQAGPTEIRITLSEGGISPNGQRVNLHHGEQFTLEITTDRDDILHVHGFDTEITVKAGERTTKTMRADRIGRYEIESHDPPLVTVVLQIS